MSRIGRPQKYPFWSRVDKRGQSDCWIWTGPRQKFGYGIVRFNGSSQIAHRVSWQLTHGPIDPGLCVCHHCDNPPCVNPAHLFLGTRVDNNQDRQRKGRYPDMTGERNWNAKLTPESVAAIRASYQSGATVAQLARTHGIGETQAGRIIRGESWAGQP